MSPLRVLLAIADAPPVSSSRAERWARLTRELGRRGHRVTVLHAVAPPGLTRRDPELERVMQEGTPRLLDVDGGLFPRLAHPGGRWAPGRLAARCLSELAWPDCWSRFALRALDRTAVREGDFDVVVSSGLPFSAHLVGYELARSRGMPWVADYGDPWSSTLTPEGWVANAHRPAERLLASRASRLLVTTPATACLFASALSFPEAAIDVLPAGVEDLGLGPPPEDGPLRLCHAGAVYGPRAAIAPFLSAVERVREEGLPLALTWFGGIARPADRRRVARLADVHRPFASQAEIREAERQAHAVVVFGNHGGVQLPAKIWRALGTGRLVACVAADAEDPLHELQGGRPPGHPIRLAENREPALREALRRLDAERRAQPCSGPAIEGDSWEDRAGQLEESLRRAVADVTAGSRSAARAPSAVALVRRMTLTGARPRARLQDKLAERRCEGARGSTGIGPARRGRGPLSDLSSFLLYWDYPQRVWARELAEVLRTAAIPREAAILDAPSGNGAVSYWLLRELENPFELIDVSPEAIATARRHLAEPRVRILEADLHDVAVDGPAADAWLFVNSLYLLPEPGRVVDRLRPRVRLLAGIFPHVDHVNYRNFVRRNPEVRNVSEMDKEETLRFFERHGYRLTLERELGFVNHHRLRFRPFILVARRFLSLVDPLLRGRRPGAYWLGLFERS